MKIEELNIEVSDAEELEDELCGMFDDFLLDLEKKDGMTRPVTVDDPVEADDCKHLWTHEAQLFIDSEMAWLTDIAEKYFPNQDIAIESGYYIDL